MSLRPAPRRSPQDVPTAARALAWSWWCAAALLGFLTLWAWRRGLWTELVHGDPSGISLLIVAVTLGVTLWCGARAARLAEEAGPAGAWRREWVAAGATSHASELLAERAHGPHETAWWLTSATIKLGLLGTVVGFIVMSRSIAQAPSLDFEQVQGMLQRMTGGMAIALYTTLVGLVANLWLGLQLLLLDRLADRLIADVMAPAGTPEAATRAPCPEPADVPASR